MPPKIDFFIIQPLDGLSSNFLKSKLEAPTQDSGAFLAGFCTFFSAQTAVSFFFSDLALFFLSTFLYGTNFCF